MFPKLICSNHCSSFPHECCVQNDAVCSFNLQSSIFSMLPVLKLAKILPNWERTDSNKKLASTLLVIHLIYFHCRAQTFHAVLCPLANNTVYINVFNRFNFNRDPHIVLKRRIQSCSRARSQLALIWNYLSVKNIGISSIDISDKNCMGRWYIDWRLYSGVQH